MIEQRCPYCHKLNAPQNAYCNQCGASFDKNHISLRRQTPVSIAGYDVTPRHLKQVGVSVALSIMALLAEAGVIWLHRRVQRMRDVPPTLPSSRKLAKKGRQNKMLLPQKQDEKVVTVYRERIVEVRRWGRPMQRIIERIIWRQEPKN